MVFLMSNDIEVEHATQYENEREKRWGMAEDGEEVAIKKICKIFSEILLINEDSITFERYDKLWFEVYDISLVCNEWVKGVSDYLIKIALDEEKYLLVEIKLKSEEYRKTTSGGETKNGSKISNYGCNSFYLDIVPVLRNMNNFIQNTNNQFISFIVAFVKEDFSEINIISLAKINTIITKGWKKSIDTRIDVCIFGEGYGQNTYLIPKDATANINSLTKENLERIILDEYPKPYNKQVK